MGKTKTKLCSKCRRELPISEFRISGVYSDGIPMHHSYCNDCTRDYQRYYFKTRYKLTLDDLVRLLDEGRLNFTQILMLADMRTREYERANPRWRKSKSDNNLIIWERI